MPLQTHVHAAINQTCPHMEPEPDLCCITEPYTCVHTHTCVRCPAEVEVMIAEPAARRKGLAKEAILLLLSYAAEELKVRHCRRRRAAIR